METVVSHPGATTRWRTCPLPALLAVTLALVGCSNPPLDEHFELPPMKVAKRWATRFCSASIGSTPQELRRLMGLPTQDSLVGSSARDPEAGPPPGGAHREMHWWAYQFRYSAYFDEHDRASTLVIDDTFLRRREARRHACEPFRSG